MEEKVLVEEKVLLEEYSKARNILQSKLNYKVTINHKKVLWSNIAAAVSAQGDSSRDGEQCKKFENLCMKTKMPCEKFGILPLVVGLSSPPRYRQSLK